MGVILVRQDGDKKSPDQATNNTTQLPSLLKQQFVGQVMCSPPFNFEALQTISCQSVST